jgi:hypothetical protein
MLMIASARETLRALFSNHLFAACVRQTRQKLAQKIFPALLAAIALLWSSVPSAAEPTVSVTLSPTTSMSVDQTLSVNVGFAYQGALYDYYFGKFTLYVDGNVHSSVNVYVNTPSGIPNQTKQFSVTGLSVGPHTIRVDFCCEYEFDNDTVTLADSIFGPPSVSSDSIQFTVTTNLTARTLTLSPSLTTLTFDTGRVTQITATPSVGSGAITYSTSGPCSIGSTTGLLTTTGAGTCVVNANVASDGTYAAATASMR